MEELFNLKYKEEVDLLKEDEESYEALGDAKYIQHPDREARLYWAFCRPSGSHPKQIEDEDELVSIMAFNHSRLGALERFTLLHKNVVADENLRTKIRNRTRMLFRDLVDNDFRELNLVLDLVPVFLPVAIDQLKNGRKWNDIFADEIEGTKFLRRVDLEENEDFLEALLGKIQSFQTKEGDEVKSYIESVVEKKEQVDKIILEHIQTGAMEWIEESDLHILQKKSIEKLARKLLEV